MFDDPLPPAVIAGLTGALFPLDDEGGINPDGQQCTQSSSIEMNRSNFQESDE